PPQEGDAGTLTVDRWPLVHEDAREPGVYRLQRSGGRAVYFVVQPDHRESDLTPCTDADREKVSKVLAMTYENDLKQIIGETVSAAQDFELWRWFMIGVVAMLCLEVWLTRRIVKDR